LPHIGSGTVTTRNAMGQLVVDNLISWFSTGKPLTPIAESQPLLSSSSIR
jgi:lactate dehydrogenase-like 2-hydroxyacid dehydrogenase